MTGEGGPGPAGGLCGGRKRFSEGRDRGIARVRSWGERSVDDEPQGRGHGPTRLLVTRRCPAQEMVEHGSEAEYVAELVGRAPGAPFRARVRKVQSVRFARPALRTPIEIEPDELDQEALAPGRCGEKEGSWGHVAVNDPEPMRLLEAGGGLEADFHRLLPRGCTAGGEQVGQELTRQTFPDDEGQPVGGFADLHQTRDVRVTYPARPAKLVTTS